MDMIDDLYEKKKDVINSVTYFMEFISEMKSKLKEEHGKVVLGHSSKKALKWIEENGWKELLSTGNVHFKKTILFLFFQQF
uniref:Uncharacterized protein n=1 Tax=Onchocerca volvulus TaxID=6282 RepID=A0A8R1TS07_ONCVO